MTLAERDLFIRVDSVPREFSSLIYNSKDAYVITRRSIAQSGKTLVELVEARFGKVSAIAEDLSLRGFYIFVGDRE